MEVRRVAAIGSSSTERTWRLLKETQLLVQRRAIAGARLSAANLWLRLSSLATPAQDLGTYSFTAEFFAGRLAAELACEPETNSSRSVSLT